MARSPKIIVDYVADTTGMQKGMASAESGTNRFATSLKSIGKAGALAAGAAGIGALVATVKIGIDEFTQSQKVTAQTQAAIKSTGEAAHVTAGHVQDLAGAILKKSGIDDEAVQSGENMLLTFTNVRNEVGKGNKIFDQATGVMADMSVALGQDMPQSALQLGKALQDPVKGMTALRRVGVAFTQAQQDQVKALVDSGHSMQAQKLILHELTKEFGGSAEAAGKTLPGQLSILREEFNNFAGDMVGKVAPAIQSGLQWLQENWPQISAAIGQGVQAITPVLQGLGSLIVGVVNLIRDNWGTIGPIFDALAATVGAALKIIGDALKLVGAILSGDWSQAWQTAKQTVSDAIALIQAVITQNLLPIQQLLAGLWNGLAAAAAAAWSAVTSTIQNAAQAIIDWLRGNWPLILGVLTGPIGLAVAAIATHWDAIKSGAVSAWDGIKSVVTAAANAVKSVLTSIWAAIQSAIEAAVAPITAAIGRLAAAIHKPGEAAQEMLGAVRGAFGAIAGVIEGVIGAVAAAAQKVADAMMKPIDAAKGVINAVLGRFNALRIPGFEVNINMPGPIPDIHFGWGGQDLPDVPLLAKGGVIASPTLAMVGEGAGREIVAPEELLREIVGQGASYTLNMYPRRADPADVAWGFRRLELAHTGR